MIRVEIWTKSTHVRELGEEPLRPVLLFRGEMPQVPRVGELLNVFAFESAEPVLEVWWNLDEGSAELYVAPDRTGEYLSEARKRGIPQQFYPAA